MKYALIVALLMLFAGCQSQPAADPRIADLQNQLSTLQKQNADLQQKQADISEIQQQPKLAGRYFTPETLVAQMNNTATERAAQLYLVGAYDLTQDSGRSCAARGTTTPAQLEQVFSDYLKSHTSLLHTDRTAASVAAQALTENWPCHK